MLFSAEDLIYLVQWLRLGWHPLWKSSARHILPSSYQKFIWKKKSSRKAKLCFKWIKLCLYALSQAITQGLNSFKNEKHSTAERWTGGPDEVSLGHLGLRRCLPSVQGLQQPEEACSFSYPAELNTEGLHFYKQVLHVNDFVTDQGLEKDTHETHQTILKKKPILVCVFWAGIYKIYKNFYYLPAYIYP